MRAMYALLVGGAVAVDECVNPEALNRDTDFCRDVVTYSFRGNSSSLKDLNDRAIRRVGVGLNATRAWYLLATPCLESLKQLACIQTYISCHAPKPCRLLCDMVNHTCNEQLVKPHDIGIDVQLECVVDNCTSGGNAKVGYTTEAYAGSACRGYVTDVAILPMGLPPPGRVQEKLEAEAGMRISTIPTWTGKMCQASATALICGTMFPIPGSTLLISNSSLPRRASAQYCSTFVASCRELFSRASGYLHDYLIHAKNCSNLPNIGDMIMNFKLDHLDLLTTAGTVYTAGVVRTEPFYFEPKPDIVDVACVHGSGKVPPGRSYYLEIENTACAVTCPMPYRTRNALFLENLFYLFGALTSIVISFYTCLTYTWVVERRQTQPLLAFNFSLVFVRKLIWLVPYSKDLALNGLWSGDQSTLICYDAVSRRVGSDGGTCEVQSYGLVSSVLAEQLACMFVAFDVLVRVAYVPDDPNKYVYKYYMPFIVCTTLLVVVPLAATNAAGAASEYGSVEAIFCFIRLDQKGKLMLRIWNLVLVLPTTLTVLFMLRGVYHLIKAMHAVKSMKSVQPMPDKLHNSTASRNLLLHVRLRVETLQLIRIPLAFLFFRVGEMCWNFGVYIIMIRNTVSANKKSMDSWYDCLFEHWQLSFSAQRAMCGDVPTPYKWRGGQGLLEVLTMVLVVRDIICALLFSLSRESVRAWIKQHPNLRPYFCNLDKRQNLIDRVTCSLASCTRAMMSVCEATIPSTKQVSPAEHNY